MTAIGWILMIVTWGLLFTVLGFCYIKILTDSSGAPINEKSAE